MQVAVVLKHNAMLRDKLERVRTRLVIHVENVDREIEKLDEALRIEQTGYCVLLKQTDKGWTCVAVVNSLRPPDDVPEDFDLCLPIPKPESMPEWEGW